MTVSKLSEARGTAGCHGMDRDYGKYNGIFVPSDGVGFGHLVVDGRNSLLTLVDENPLPIGGEWPRDIHG